MKKNFLTGLVLLLPFIITILIIAFVINVLTNPFIGVVASTLKYYNILNKPFFLLSAQQVLMLSSKLIVLVGFCVLSILVGMLGQFMILKAFGNIGDTVIHRIPVVNSIYKATKDVVYTILGPKKQSNFSSVVLVPFPFKHNLSLGFITNPHQHEETNALTEEEVSVFVPGTPNPSMGFMLIFKKNQIIPTDLKVEEALKLIVSCGVIWPTVPLQSKSIDKV